LQTEFFHDKGAGASFAGSFHVCCACRFFSLKVLECF